MIKWLIENKDLISAASGLLNVILIAAGWIAVFYFGLRQQKVQLKNTAKIKIYEELYSLKKEVDAQSENLGLKLGKFSLPFLAMSWKKNTPEGKKEALVLWREYLAELSEMTHGFVRSYLKLWTHSDMWIGAMPELKTARNEPFIIQLKKLTDSLYQHHRYLLDRSIKQFDWSLWDGEEIEKKSEELHDKFDEIAIGYLDDYLGLIHNHLASPILGYKKLPRENFANMEKFSSYHVLSEKGLKKIIP